MQDVFIQKLNSLMFKGIRGNPNEQRNKRAVSLIMRDKTHTEHIERWAEFVKTHPRHVWIREVGPLIDAQIIMANAFYERLAKVEGGIEKIRKLRKLEK